MTNYIGPINITIPHIRDDDNIKQDGSEQINIVCSPEQAKQILGLCENSVKTVYGNMRVVRSKDSRWGILPINTSENLKINQAMTHKGIYQLLGEPEEIYLNPKVSRVNIPTEMLSKNINEIISVLYSQGGEDAGEIEISDDFDPVDETVLINEDYSGVYTGNWETATSYGMDNVSVSTSGNQLYLVGRNTNTGVAAPWGGIHLENKQTFNPPFTLEFDLEWVTGTDHNMSMYMFETKPHVWTDLTTHASNTNYFRIYLYHHGGKLYYAVLKCISGVISYLIPETELSIPTEKNPSFKVNYYPGGDIEIFIDKLGGTDYNLIWGKANLGHNWSSPGFAYHMDNMSGSIITMLSSIFKITVQDKANFPNTVVLPPGAVVNATPDFTRASEDGNLQCFKDPDYPINYQIDSTNWYKGMVKGMNGNYDDNVYRLITSNEIELDPTKLYISNGLIKIQPFATGVYLFAWDGSNYTGLAALTLPSTIKLIQPHFVNKDMFTLQLDRTFWTVRAGKPGVWIKHPVTPIGYGLNQCYYHDGATTTDPSAGADITMQDQFYCNIWNRGTGTCASPNPAQIYRLSIIQQNPTTIKSDSIPATEKTGIIVYDTNILDTADDGMIYRTREWFKPTRQTLALQGV
jgi:hypothetical protein